LSLPNGKIQREHTDYQSELLFPVFSGIVSFDDSTTLDIREGSVRRRVRILKGECVIFQGNVIHSGSSYLKSNRRLFFKAMPAGYDLPTRADNTVTILRENCDFCHYSFKSKDEKNYHNKEGVCGKGYLV
jgi:hypothetical protein